MNRPADEDAGVVGHLVVPFSHVSARGVAGRKRVTKGGGRWMVGDGVFWGGERWGGGSEGIKAGAPCAGPLECSGGHRRNGTGAAGT